MDQGLNCTPTLLNEDQSGNEWFDLCGSGSTDVMVDPTISFHYYAHNLNIAGFATTQPNCSSPLWISSLDLEICPTLLDKKGTSCNNPYAGITVNPDDFENYIINVKGLISEYNAVIFNLNEIVDDGDTQGLLSSITTTSGGNLKNLLISESPFLSDEVMIAYCNNGPSPGHLKQVLIANSPLSNKLMTELNYINLPNGIRNQINAAQIGVSDRQRLEKKIERYEGEIQLLINDLQRRFIQASDRPREKQLLIDMGGLQSQKGLAEILISEGDLVGAQAIVNGILQDPELISNNENQQFCDLTNCVIGMVDQGRTIYSLTSAEVQIVQDVATSNTSISNKAQVILDETVGTQTYYPITKISNSNNLRQIAPKAEITQSSELKMYPNPTSGLVDLDYDTQIILNLEVEIYDVIGQLIIKTTVLNKQLDMSDFEEGIYFINFINEDGKKIDIKKVIISK